MKLFTESKNVELNIYSECKYTASKEVFENEKKVSYQYCTGFEITDGKGAEIEKTDGTCIDDYDEYLILYFEDGTTATFRNSYVDMFLMGNSRIG